MMTMINYKSWDKNMTDKELTPVQAYLKKVAPLGGALSPDQQQELKRLIAAEQGATNSSDMQDALKDALALLNPAPR